MTLMAWKRHFKSCTSPSSICCSKSIPGNPGRRPKSMVELQQQKAGHPRRPQPTPEQPPEQRQAKPRTRRNSTSIQEPQQEAATVPRATILSTSVDQGHWLPKDLSTRVSDLVTPEDEQLAAAKAMALRMLNRSPLSSWELWSRLQQHDINPQLAEQVLQILVSKGLQSDADVCEAWVRSRWNQQLKAATAIRQELVQKHIDPDLIEAALQSFFGVEVRVQSRHLQDAHTLGADGSYALPEVNEHLDAEEQRGLALAAQLLSTVKRRLASMPEALSKDAKRRRLIAWLQRRGHSWDVVATVMKLCIT